MTKPPAKKENLGWNSYDDEEEEPHIIHENDIPLGNYNVSIAYSLIDAEVLLHQGERGDDSDGKLLKTKVLNHLTDENGNLI